MQQIAGWFSILYGTFMSLYLIVCAKTYWKYYTNLKRFVNSVLILGYIILVVLGVYILTL
jgi:hypothetical protein